MGIAAIAWVLTQAASLDPTDVPPPVRGRVTIEEQGGSVDLSATSPHLSLSLRIQSNLPAEVSAVEVGVLYGDDADELTRVDAGRLYSEGRGPPGVGVYRQTVPVQLAPQGSHRLEVAVPLGANEPPSSFQAHLLSYRPARWTPALWIELLQSHAPADELSAVRAFGLLGDASARAEARHLRQQEPGWGEALREVLAAPIPPRPTADETRLRFAAAAALAVLEQQDAAAPLQQLADDPSLSRFDEPWQVLRTAQLLGNPFDAPVAHVFPADAAVGRVVIQWTRELAQASDPVAAPAPERSPEPSTAPSPELEREQIGDLPPSPVWPWAVALGVGLITFVILRALAHWARHRSDS